MSVAAIIVAAGEGRRFGGSVPKTYLPLAGRPMILRTLERCFAARSIDDIIVVVGDSELSRCEELIRRDAAFQNRSNIASRDSAAAPVCSSGCETMADVVLRRRGADPCLRRGQCR